VVTVNPYSGSEPRTVTRRAFTARQLHRIRQVVLSAARRAGLSRQRCHHLVLAVNEAATNVIKYAGGHGRVEVLQDDGNRLIAVVSDHGPGLPARLAVEPPGSTETGGRGLWLMNQVCDRVELRSDAGGTRVRLEMSLTR
jgi:anti-sigma regulatory factor (Ser/Thr protein kinase)